MIRCVQRPVVAIGTTTIDLEDEGDTPDDDTVQKRLERAFQNSHDRDRIKKVYNGRYRAAVTLLQMI